MTETVRAEKIAVVETLLNTMNGLCETGHPMTIEQAREMFTEDCRMVLNGEQICEGHTGLMLHGNDIRGKVKSCRFNLPFERTVVEGDDVFVYYTVDVVGHDGARGRAFDMCIYSVRDGRISNICEVVHFAGHAVEVESFA